MRAMLSVLLGPSPELPLLREKRALFSSVLAWRRAWLEHEHRANPSESLVDDLISLRLYGHAAATLDPLSEFVLNTDLGELPETLALEASFRIETAGALAWGLGLCASMPRPVERADVDALSALFPLDGHPGLSRARARPMTDLQRELTRWADELTAARAKRDAFDEHSQLVFSRTFERTRGLTFLCSNVPFLEDVTLV